MYKILKDELDKNFLEELRRYRYLQEQDSSYFNTEDYNNINVSSAEDLAERNYQYDLAKLKEKYGKTQEATQQYYWIGINPYKLNEEVKMKELYEKMLSFTNRRWCNRCMFNIEAHTKEGYRVHSHMIVITTTKRHRIIEQLSKYLGCEKNFIEVQHYTYGYSERVKYIKGEKSEEKQELVEKDKIQRIEEGIKDYIEKLEDI